MFDYTNPNFDISAIEGFNNIDGLGGISSYMDFAISSTIHKQIPNVDVETEKMHAKNILHRYLQGDNCAFTSTYAIRSNMNTITPQKIKELMIKSLIELDAYNQRVLHQLQPKDYIGECATYVTSVIASGQLEQIQPWIDQNIDTFIDSYITSRYKEDEQRKQQMEAMAYSIPTHEKALEKLNLEMKLNEFKTK